ncbi:MAG: hypothetical protein JWM84_1550 [Nocardioides sp.]|nr:hypothetical protein [Nocardioides sp.]
MQIDNEFQVRAQPREVWEYLQRTEDVVQCIPGAVILEKISEDEYRGQVTVKLGPLSVVLQGLVTIKERDHEAQRMSLVGRAKDTKGRGATDAGVTVDVAAEADGTRVTLHSDIKITGKIAQFGRGVMKDVSQRIAEEFARNLEARLTAPEPEPEAVMQDVGAGTVTSEDAPAAALGDRAPRRAEPSAGKAASSVGGLRLVAGALVRAAAAALGRLLRKLVKPAGGTRRGPR